jgi:hypothetical protein
MTVQEYHDRVLAEARTLVAQGYTTDAAVAQAHRNVQAIRGPQPIAISSVLDAALSGLTGRVSPPEPR